MKIRKIFSNLFTPAKHGHKTKGLPRPIKEYNPNNITADEFKEYVHYLSENKINERFIEPTKFTPKAERAETKNCEDYVHYLAENRINRIFYC